MRTNLFPDFSIAKAVEIEVGGCKEKFQDVANSEKDLHGKVIIAAVAKSSQGSPNGHWYIGNKKYQT